MKKFSEKREREGDGKTWIERGGDGKKEKEIERGEIEREKEIERKRRKLKE